MPRYLADEYGGPPLSEIDHQYDTTAAMGAYHGLTVKAGRRHITFIDLAKCPNGVMVVLKQSTDVILDSRTDGSGENLIDPTSILQVRDEAMLGNTWCRSEHCAATRMKKPGRSLGHFGDCQQL
ncbi:hypothetical protein IF1G_09395 [Cordyceps javanica]|uniref:Uncharacterized protein n=1 Tax=Cordyceps javanica TaxID=43265 RepID=A0A545VPV1_9HYPO|nr:hypothetical protein IF1G_09395 [Cordyceps javanica]TQW03760.1 hypothetical protein IF2G_08589 [Cordyceps javanica]